MLANLKKVLSKEDIKCRRFILLKIFVTKNVYFFMYHRPLPAHFHIVTIDGG
jgi:hypothetical protein